MSERFGEPEIFREPEMSAQKNLKEKEIEFGLSEIYKKIDERGIDKEKVKENLIFDNKLNLYTRELNKFKEEFDKAGCPEDFIKLEKITYELSKEFFKEKSNLDLENKNLDTKKFNEFLRQIGRLHDDPTPKNSLTNKEFFISNEMSKEGNRLFNELPRDSQKHISRIIYGDYVSRDIPPKPDQQKFNPKEPDYLPHMARANYFAGLLLYKKLREKIKNNEEVRILDLGAGVGNTTGAIIHFIQDLAQKEDNIDPNKIKLIFDCVEHQDALHDIFREYSKKLKNYIPNVTINLHKEDMVKHVEDKVAGAKEKGRYDAIVGNYSMNYLGDGYKNELMKNAKELLNPEGILYRADFDGLSEINKNYFNFTLVGIMRAANTAEEAKELMKQSGFKSTLFSDLEDPDSEYYQKLTTRYFGKEVAEEMINDTESHNGYICVGKK